ncbi:MAG: hypothetical protein Q8P06_01905 [Candidatus Azambacteria bacterium]|nr:hypothetical protein [Candidatus Azambacteria bacterium]
MAVALTVNLMFWWLGIIAGFAGGYLAYEFREVLRAIPVAWSATRKGINTAGQNVFNSIFNSSKNWLAKPHPFYYPAAIIVAPFSLLGIYLLLLLIADSLANSDLSLIPKGILFTIILIELLVAALMSPVIIIPFIAFFAFIGARVGEHCYWYPFTAGGFTMGEVGEGEKFEELQKKGYSETILTFKNVIRWTLKGVGLSIWFFVWPLWKNLFKELWFVICPLSDFLWKLVKIIHSNKRLLCGIDAAIGGGVTYLWLVPSSITFWEGFLLSVFGGLIGGLIGVFNYKIISVRVLHLAP